MDEQKRQKITGTDVEKMLYNKCIEGDSYTQVHYAGKDIQFLYEMMEKVLIMKSRLFNPKLVKTLKIHFEISSCYDAVHMEANFSSGKGLSNVFVYLLAKFVGNESISEFSTRPEWFKEKYNEECNPYTLK